MTRSGVAALTLTALVAASQAGAQVVVNPASGRVSIRAAGLSVSTLLDQLAQKTGMTVEYEKGPPRQSVSLTLDDRTPAQAVVAILDGLNIPYALSLTADGLKVQTLVIADASAPPKAGRTRVGRETSMAPPPDDSAGDVPPEQPTPDPGQAEAPQEQPQGGDPTQPPQPPQRRGVPAPPPVTLAPAFPPFGGAADPRATRPEAQPDPVPQQPQAEKTPEV